MLSVPKCGCSTIFHCSCTYNQTQKKNQVLEIISLAARYSQVCCLNIANIKADNKVTFYPFALVSELVNLSLNLGISDTPESAKPRFHYKSKQTQVSSS